MIRQPETMTRADLRFLQNLAYLVPGYRAYRDVSLRRGEDSRLRARVLAAMKGIRDEIRRLREAWEAQGVDPRWSALLQEADRELARMAEDLRYCPRQAEAFFLLAMLPSDVLDELLEADLLVLADLEYLGHAVRGIPDVPPRRKGMRQMLGTLQNLLQTLASHLVLRDGVLSRIDRLPSENAA